MRSYALPLVLLCAACTSTPPPAAPVRPLSSAVQTTPASAPASRPAPTPPPTTLTVPFTATAIKCDGEPNEPAWNSAARTGSFLDTTTQHLVRPYSDTRLLADKNNLYLLLYAADEDVRVPLQKQHDKSFGDSDHFTVKIRRQNAPAITYVVEIAPNRTLYDAEVTAHTTSAHRSATDLRWSSHIMMGADLDGTLNDPKDEDEEWLIESALPLVSLHAKSGESLLMSIERCDTPKGGVRSCGAWGRDASGEPVGVVILPKG